MVIKLCPAIIRAETYKHSAGPVVRKGAVNPVIIEVKGRAAQISPYAGRLIDPCYA